MFLGSGRGRGKGYGRRRSPWQVIVAGTGDKIRHDLVGSGIEEFRIEMRGVVGARGHRARKIGTLACGRGPGLGQAHPLQEEIAAIAPSMDRIRRGWDCEDDEKETSQRLEAGFPAPHGTDADSTAQEFLAGAASPKEFLLLVAVRNHMGAITWALVQIYLCAA